MQTQTGFLPQNINIPRKSMNQVTNMNNTQNNSDNRGISRSSDLDVLMGVNAALNDRKYKHSQNK
jgi:hypothetical protein